MELQKLVERAQRLNSYVVAIVKSRNPEEFFVLALTDTYEDAVMCRRVLNADGIYDVIIVPPFERKEIPPKEPEPQPRFLGRCRRCSVLSHTWSAIGRTFKED